jgi:hypothetical protein
VSRLPQTKGSPALFKGPSPIVGETMMSYGFTTRL